MQFSSIAVCARAMGAASLIALSQASHGQRPDSFSLLSEEQIVTVCAAVLASAVIDEVKANGWPREKHALTELAVRAAGAQLWLAIATDVPKSAARTALLLRIGEQTREQIRKQQHHCDEAARQRIGELSDKEAMDLAEQGLRVLARATEASR